MSIYKFSTIFRGFKKLVEVGFAVGKPFHSSISESPSQLSEQRYTRFGRFRIGTKNCLVIIYYYMVSTLSSYHSQLVDDVVEGHVVQLLLHHSDGPQQAAVRAEVFRNQGLLQLREYSRRQEMLKIKTISEVIFKVIRFAFIHISSCIHGLSLVPHLLEKGQVVYGRRPDGSRYGVPRLAVDAGGRHGRRRTQLVLDAAPVGQDASQGLQGVGLAAHALVQP